MKIEVNYKVINSDFSQERANEYNHGDPGQGNLKYHNTWKYDLNNIKSIKQIDNSETTFVAIDYDGNRKEYSIENLFHLQCELEDGRIEDYFVSKLLIRNTHTTKGADGKTRFYFYLKDDHKFFFAITAFFAHDDLTEEFKTTEWKDIEFQNDIKSILKEESGTFTPKHLS